MFKKILFLAVVGLVAAYVLGYNPANVKGALTGAASEGSNTALASDNDGWSTGS